MKKKVRICLYGYHPSVMVDTPKRSTNTVKDNNVQSSPTALKANSLMWTDNVIGGRLTRQIEESSFLSGVS